MGSGFDYARYVSTWPRNRDDRSKVKFFILRKTRFPFTWRASWISQRHKSARSSTGQQQLRILYRAGDSARAQLHRKILTALPVVIFIPTYFPGTYYCLALSCASGRKIADEDTEEFTPGPGLSSRVGNFLNFGVNAAILYHVASRIIFHRVTNLLFETLTSLCSAINYIFRSEVLYTEGTRFSEQKDIHQRTFFINFS